MAEYICSRCQFNKCCRGIFPTENECKVFEKREEDNKNGS